jgi:transcriptional regulator with XRE-family HTH domain
MRKGQVWYRTEIKDSKEFKDKTDKIKGRLEQARLNKGYTQEQAAQAIGIDVSLYHKWIKPDGFKGSSYPRFENIETICEVLDCDFLFLTGKQKSIKREIGTAAEETGLSDKSIEFLSNGIKGRDKRILDILIETGLIMDIVAPIDTYCQKYAKDETALLRYKANRSFESVLTQFEKMYGLRKIWKDKNGIPIIIGKRGQRLYPKHTPTSK